MQQMLNNILHAKQKRPPRLRSGRRDMEANDKSTVNIDLCISVLENLRNRSKFYATMFPHLTDDYLAELINTEHTAIDSIISILKNRE